MKNFIHRGHKDLLKSHQISLHIYLIRPCIYQYIVLLEQTILSKLTNLIHVEINDKFERGNIINITSMQIVKTTL